MIMDIQLQLTDGRFNPRDKNKVITFKHKSRVVLGRDDRCDFTLPCKQKLISRLHARLDKKGRDVVITDMSANGTFLNSEAEPIGQNKGMLLRCGDTIRIGDYVLTFWSRQALLDLHSVSPVPARPAAVTLAQSINGVAGSQPAASQTTQIPEDWNTPVKKMVPRPSTTGYSNRQFVDGLLKGLGVSNRSVICEQLTAEQMVVIGRCLRAALNGMHKQRDYIDKIKGSLLPTSSTAKKKYNLSAEVNAFLKKMLDNDNADQSILPLQLVEYHKALIDDQSAIYKSFNKAIDAFREELSPLNIEATFQECRAKDSKITCRLLPDIGRWDTYKRLWGEKCVNFKRIIQAHFAENMKALEFKRAQQSRDERPSR
ncbi:MAG: FHA domain-containing protein [Cellvibrionaceae bacterium]|nr:FHA domain-containing protein [Cellvibrionaceae bacterium]